MSAADYDPSQLTQGWKDVRASDEAAELEAELAREVSAGHVLTGRKVTAVAVRKLRKDVIYRLAADKGWAWVHLTWKSEPDSRWPSTTLVETWDQLVDVLRESARG